MCDRGRSAFGAVVCDIWVRRGCAGDDQGQEGMTSSIEVLGYSARRR